MINDQMKLFWAAMACFCLFQRGKVSFWPVSGGKGWFWVVSSGFGWFRVIPFFSNNAGSLRRMIFTLEVSRWEKVLCYFLKVAFVVAFAMTSSKFGTMIFWKTLLHNVKFLNILKFSVQVSG